MVIFFKSRTALRQFGSKNGKRVDNGNIAGAKRWAFEIQKKAK